MWCSWTDVGLSGFRKWNLEFFNVYNYTHRPPDTNTKQSFLNRLCLLKKSDQIFHVDAEKQGWAGYLTQQISLSRMSSSSHLITNNSTRRWMGTISPWQYLHFALQFPKNGGCLPFSSFQLKVFFHLKKNWSCLWFSKILRLSTIFHLVGSKEGCIPKICFMGCLEVPQNFLWWVVVVSTALCGHTNFVFGLKLGCNNSLSHKLQLTVEDSVTCAVW